MLTQDWNDFRIAQQVAISGTLTGAGEALGINHATVLRHINRLEASLDTIPKPLEDACFRARVGIEYKA